MRKKLPYRPPLLVSTTIFLPPLCLTTGTPTDGYQGFRRPPPSK